MAQDASDTSPGAGLERRIDRARALAAELRADAADLEVLADRWQSFLGPASGASRGAPPSRAS